MSNYAQLCADAGLGDISADIINAFKNFDADNSGAIDSKELTKALKELGETPSASEVANQIKEVDADNSGQIEFNEFLVVLKNLKDGKDTAFGRTVTKKGDISMNVLTSAHGTHSFSEEEKVAFAEYINDVLGPDPHCKHFLPLDPDSMDIFAACRDGILLCKLINSAVPGTIDERVINKADASKGVLSPRGNTKTFLNVHQATENLNLAVNSAKAIGCTVINVGASDITEAREHVILGLLWQIIRIGLLASINLEDHPELIKLLEEGETLADLMKLGPEGILLRWMNYHLREAGESRRIKNFSGDIQDSFAYTVVLAQVAPKGSGVNRDPLNISDHTKRADAVITNAKKIDVKAFIKPKDIAGNPKPNSKLNLAFAAAIFNAHNGLGELTEEERGNIDDYLFNATGSREARAFALWINSLGVQPFVTDLFEDLRSGIVILRVMDAIRPKTVDWKKVVDKPSMNKFQMVGNCNLAVDYAKNPFKFSVVGIAGSDLQAGNEKLTLAVVWQLMRYQILELLKKLGSDVNDEQIVAWANDLVKAKGSQRRINGFGDQQLSDGQYILELIDAVRPGCVDKDLVLPGQEKEDKMQNARLALSLSRKLGATIFALPEDIVEVKPKLMMTVFASLMYIAKGGK